MNKEFGFSPDFDISQVPEDLREKVRANVDKWKQAYEKLYQARIQELQERINQLEFELQRNQIGKIIGTDYIIFRHIT